MTPGASQLVGVVRHGQSVGHRGHVVHLEDGKFSRNLTICFYLGVRVPRTLLTRERTMFFVSEENILVSIVFLRRRHTLNLWKFQGIFE